MNRSVLILLLMLLFPVLLHAQSGYRVLRNVQWLASDAVSPPAPDAPWQQARLPWRLATDAPDAAYAWFRITVPSPPDVGQALYLTNHMYSVDVFLNAERVGGSDQPPGKLGMGWTRPLLVVIPQGLWRAGDNELLVRLALAPFTNVLPELRLGDEAVLRQAWQRKHFWQYQVTLVALVLCVLMGLFTFGLWLQRRRDIEFGLFAGTALGLALPLCYLSLPYAVLPHRMLLLAGLAGIFLGAGCFLLFLARLLQLRLPAVPPAGVALVLALPCLALPVLDVAGITVLLMVVYTAGLLALAGLLLLAVRRLREGVAGAGWVCLGGVLIGIVCVRDYLLVMNSDVDSLSNDGLLLPMVIPAMLLFFAPLLQRYIRALHDSEVLRVELADRVAAITAELEQTHQVRRELELNRARERQRQQIYRDLHDDVGARLLAIAHGLESNRQALLARSALASLRDTVSASRIGATPFGQLLELIEEDLEIRCRSADLDFDLTVEGDLPGTVWPPERAHHLWRILQEVVNNTIRHAAATRLALWISVTGQQVLLVLEDDGCGFDTTTVQGNGLRNIRYRAHQLHAEAAWASRPGAGTRFELRFTVEGLA